MASIYKRNNIWYLPYYLNDKRVRKKIGGSKKLTELVLKDVEVKIAKNRVGWEEITDTSFYDFREKYLEYLKENTRSTTYVRYRKALQHFTDFLENCGAALAELSQISFHLIEEYKKQSYLILQFCHLILT